MGRSERQPVRSALAVLLLLALMLGPRLPSIGTLGYMQYLWFQRIDHFVDAVKSGDFAATFQGPHPGVTLMWILGAGLELRTWFGGVPDVAGRLWVFELMQIVWSTSVMVLLFFALRRTLVTYGTESRRAHWTALLACGLAALNPMFLSLTQVMSLDGPLAAHVALALCLFLTALRTGAARDYALAGLAAGLAALTKMSALIFVFAMFACLLMKAARRRGAVGAWSLGSAITFGAVWLLTLFAGWPALWVSPLATARRIAVTDTQAEQLRHGEFGQLLADREDQAGLDAILDVLLHPHRPGNARVVYGRTTNAWLHYPAVVIFKTPAFSLVLALGGIAAALAAIRFAPADPTLRLVRHLSAWNGWYLLCMSIAAKKTWRYLATGEVLLELCAGLTLAWLVAVVVRRYGRGWAAALMLPLGVQVGHILSYQPHFIAYYDPAVGGQTVADEYLMLYWGEGAGEAARYMRAHARAQPVRFISENFDLSNLLRIMLGEPDFVGTPADAEFLVISYREVAMQAMSRGARFYWSSRRPEYVAAIRGVPYAWVYRLERGNDVVRAPAAPER